MLNFLFQSPGKATSDFYRGSKASRVLRYALFRFFPNRVSDAQLFANLRSRVLLKPPGILPR
jgi:hypothetical protein